MGIDMKSMALLIAIAVSLDFMMPVGTPPGAIAYSTGVVNVREMIRNGFLVNIGTGLILVILVYFLFVGFFGIGYFSFRLVKRGEKNTIIFQPWV